MGEEGGREGGREGVRETGRQGDIANLYHHSYRQKDIIVVLSSMSVGMSNHSSQWDHITL